MNEEEFNEHELLFDELYEKTKDCGRVQFINLLMEKERENQELKKQLSNSHQMKNQQKVFIQWLENKMNETHYTMFEFQAYRLAFEKYKEIIGGNNDQ